MALTNQSSLSVSAASSASSAHTSSASVRRTVGCVCQQTVTLTRLAVAVASNSWV